MLKDVPDPMKLEEFNMAAQVFKSDIVFISISDEKFGLKLFMMHQTTQIMLLAFDPNRIMQSFTKCVRIKVARNYVIWHLACLKFICQTSNGAKNHSWLEKSNSAIFNILIRKLIKFDYRKYLYFVRNYDFPL